MAAQGDIDGECGAIAPTKRDGHSQVGSTSCDNDELALQPLQVSDDFAASLPIGPAELEAIEAYLGDVLDAVLG